MKALRAVYPIATMCRVLEVSTSGYYAWCKRLPSARAIANAALGERIVAIHTASDGVYGMPKIHATGRRSWDRGQPQPRREAHAAAADPWGLPAQELHDDAA